MREEEEEEELRAMLATLFPIDLDIIDVHHSIATVHILLQISLHKFKN